MSQRIGNMVVIEVEPPGECQMCGMVAELRPYGPMGKHVCFDCAMKDPEGTDERMGVVLFGDKPKGRS